MKMKTGSKFIALMLLLMIGKMMNVSAQQEISIDNMHLRYDTDGKVIDAHDGRLVKFGNLYYLYGTSYENTDGFVTSNHYHCYSSPDLKTWTFRGHILDNQPVGVYYRPHVIYNATTRKYVLWYNWYKTLWLGQFGVATSDVPTGPFEIQNTNVATANAVGGVGDLDLFTDTDGKGYLVYTTIGTHSISIDLLTDDYLSSTRKNSGFILSNSEACSLFKRNGIYYMLADYTCAFCNEGSGACVFTASNPLGPYLYVNNINRKSSGSNFPASSAIDGNIIGANWENSGGWNDNTSSSYPDWLEISFNSAKKINEIDVFTLQDAVKLSVAPTGTMTFSKYGLTDFDLQYWSGNEWQTIPGGSITSNNRVWRKVTFDTIVCPKIRIMVNNSLGGYSRIIEMQAFEKGVNVAAAKSGGTAIASSEYWTPIIIPAQQTHIAEIFTTTDTAFVWMGDLWGSRPDGIKGHDLQYWSAPLVFDSKGIIAPMQYVNSSFKVSIVVPSDSLKLSVDKIDFEAAPVSSAKVAITANAGWELLSSAKWLHFSAMNGNSNAELAIQADDNVSFIARTAMVQMKAPGMADQFVSITQKAAIPFLTLSTNELNFGNKAPDTLTVRVTTNSNWKISGTTAWLNVIPSSGTGSALIKVIARQQNTTTALRQANIYFTATGIAPLQLSIKQNVLTAVQNVNEQHQQHLFEHYPNPTKGPVQVILNFQGKDANIDIASSLGVIIQSKEISGLSNQKKFNFDISNYAEGIYFVVVTADNLVDKEKLILKK